MSVEETETEASLPTGASIKRLTSAFQGVTDLEEVESLEVKRGCHQKEQEADDAMLGEGSSAVMHLDYFHDVRRQVYAEALIYRNTPFYASKIALEQRVEEHRLLHAHLQALERSEENGPLLMPNEFFITDLLQSPSQEPHPGYYYSSPRGVDAVVPFATSYFPGSTSSTGPFQTGQTIVSGASHIAGERAEDRGRQGPRAHEAASFWGGKHTSRVDARAQSGDQLRYRGGGRGIGGSPVASFYSSPALQTARRGPEAHWPAGQKRRGFLRVPRFPFWPAQGSGPATREGESGLALAMARAGSGPGVGEAERRAPCQHSGPSTPRDLGLAEKEAPSPTVSITETCGGAFGSTPLSARPSQSSDGPINGKQATGLFARDKKSSALGLAFDLKTGFPQGSTGVLLCHTKNGDKFWDRMDGQPVKLVSNAGGEPHVLQWNSWLQRQRQRGWFTSEGLCFMTTLGAIMGAGTFTSFWGQLQIWRTLWFIVPYTVDFITVGIPALQTELLLGNLFRGTTVKCFTQISPYMIGAAIFALLSTLLQVIVKASQGCQLLVYFFASWDTPHPWQLTEDDRQLCRSISDGETCEGAGKGTLCHWRGSPLLECLASPTGKATYFYLSRLVPEVLDPTVSPNVLQANHVASMGVVWSFVLAYVWRGLFKIGFTSALLVFLAIVLCIALTVMSFTTNDEPGLGDTEPDGVIRETLESLSHTLADVWSLRAQTLGYVLRDLALGCGVYETVSSFSKIGSNMISSGNRVGMVDFVSCLVAFISLLSVVTSMQNATGVPTYDLVNKTRSAPAYFVILPAVFDKVAASNVFSLFFYGGIFILNIQVTAIALHSLINAFAESRFARYRWRQRCCVSLIFLCFFLSLIFCSANQQKRFEFFNFVSSFIMAPGVVMLESIGVGWVNNASYQERIAGKLAVRVYAGCCLGITIFGCITSVFAGMSIYFPRLCLILVNAGFAALVAFFVREPGTSNVFKDRFYALFLANVEVFKDQILRVTLFNPPPVPALAWLSSLFRMVFGCFFSRVKPLWISRISKFWCIMVKHMVPSSMMFLIFRGFSEFPAYWASLEASPFIRSIGMAYIIFAFTMLFASPFLPKVRTWLLPPSEDYMPPYMFPLHPYRPPPTPNMFRTCAKMFAEFSASSRHASRFLYSLLVDYKRQHGLSRRASTNRAVEHEHEAPVCSLRRQLLFKRTDKSAITGDMSARQSLSGSGGPESEG